MFYVIEGPDGVGKTTLLGNVQKRLEGVGKTVCRVKFPGETEIGVKIRQLMLHGQKDLPTPFSKEAQAMLMVADFHLTAHLIIKPALERGEIVLADRYYLSTMIYQFGSLFSRSKDTEYAHDDQCKMFNQGGIFNGLMQPKRTFLVNAAKEVVHERLHSRSEGKDFFENAWEERYSMYSGIPFSVDGGIRNLMGMALIVRQNNNALDMESIAATLANRIYDDCK